MAKSMIEIGFSEEAKELLKALAAHADEKVSVEPWTIQTPEGLRAAYADAYNGIHWPLPDMEGEARRKGWRKLFVEVRE